MISTSDFKKGTRFELEGAPYQVLDVASQSPTARGSNTLVKTKLRNLVTGQYLQKTFKSGEKFDEPDLENKNASYLYKSDDLYVFMDSDTYEQYELGESETGDATNFLVDSMEVKVMIYNGAPIGVEVAPTVELNIVECEPAVRGDTVNAVTKSARLETGFELQVPMFIENGERIKIDTREGRYLSRAK